MNYYSVEKADAASPSKPAVPLSVQSAQPVALLCSEPLSQSMAGIGIRYLEMARRLPASGIQVRLVSPFRNEQERLTVEQGLPGCVTVAYSGGDIRGILGDCRAVVGQGQLVNEVIHQGLDLPLVVDLYDPWLIENLHYFETLGLDPYRNDHATWMLQLAAGDLFLCSSFEQRLFYSGLLVASGRINPISMQRDPSLDQLLRVVPFGVPTEVPAHRPVLPDRLESERRVLFGGLYDWYDPWPLLEGFERVVREENAEWRLLIVHNPNSGTPQRLVARVRAWIEREGLERNVEFLDWVPAERRYDLLQDVDVLAATHRDSLETRLSLRTRFLDALAVGCPILVTEGGAMSRQLAERGAGWVVPQRDPGAVAEALVGIAGAESPARLEVRRETAQAATDLREECAWERVLAPLVEYLRSPWRDATKADFARCLPTEAPADSYIFRLRRKLRRLVQGGQQ